MPLTNAQRKEIRSLATARGRREAGLFVAEGVKCVMDTLKGFEAVRIVAVNAWLDDNRGLLPQYVEVIGVSPAEMERLSFLKTPAPVLAVFRIPDNAFTPDDLCGHLTLALDCVQDPGNLGTIIRVADWMGVRTILATPDTVDAYSPKVVQATMGSLARVKVVYAPLAETLYQAKRMGIHIYGTILGGDTYNIYKANLQQEAILVMGNEGKGISDLVLLCIDTGLFIPPFPPDADTAESLNVAVATSIALSQFRSRNGQ